MLDVTQLIGFGCGAMSGPCLCIPAYVTGDRSALIAVTTTLTPLAGSNVTNLVDGGLANNGTDSFAVAGVGEPAAGKIIRFDFGPSARVKITEARWRQQDATSHGQWKWQGWSEDVPWTDLLPTGISADRYRQTIQRLVPLLFPGEDVTIKAIERDDETVTVTVERV